MAEDRVGSLSSVPHWCGTGLVLLETMMKAETFYLCRVPQYETVIVLPERDYEYMRLRERQLRVRDEENELILLAKGRERQIRLFYDLMNDKEPNNVS